VLLETYVKQLDFCESQAHLSKSPEQATHEKFLTCPLLKLSFINWAIHARCSPKLIAQLRRHNGVYLEAPL